MDRSSPPKRKWKKIQSVGGTLHEFSTRLSPPSQLSKSEQRPEKVNYPSHRQMGRLASYLVQPKYTSSIIDSIVSVVETSRKGNDCKIESGPKVGKTPISWIQNAFPEEMESSICLIKLQEILHIQVHGIFMECVLNRRPKKKKRKTSESEMAETIPILTYGNGHGSGSDNQWSTVVLLLPHSGIFYVAHHGGIVSQEKKGFRGMPMSWLRLQRHIGQPAAGSFLKSISRCYGVYFGLNQPKLNIPCYQWNDYEPGTPLLPPDMFGDKSIEAIVARRQYYNESVNNAHNSGSFRYGCRRYVKKAHHHKIDDGVLRIDQRTMGDVQLAVTIRDANGRPQDLSYIQISCVKNTKLLAALCIGSKRLKGQPANARQHVGDHGKMFCCGEMAVTGSKMKVTQPTKILQDENILSEINELSASFAKDAFISVLPTMQHIETMSGRVPIKEMGGSSSPSCRIITSYNLGNASHYDVGDASVCYSIWCELEPGSATNWFFVLPNVLVKYGGETYHGVVITLFHGVGISWDGRMIRHGTSITNTGTKTNGCFGWFWSADMNSAKVSLS
jgi:hypothetical protein